MSKEGLEEGYRAYQTIRTGSTGVMGFLAMLSAQDFTQDKIPGIVSDLMNEVSRLKVQAIKLQESVPSTTNNSPQTQINSSCHEIISELDFLYRLLGKDDNIPVSKTWKEELAIAQQIIRNINSILKNFKTLSGNNDIVNPELDESEKAAPLAELPEKENGGQKSNWIIGRARRYQIITFTFVFLILYRLAQALLAYHSFKAQFLTTYQLSIWFFVVFIPISYFLLWLLATWVASRHTKTSFKEKFYVHPIVTVLFAFFYITDLPRRLSETDLGSGMFKVINAFEVIVYYAFISVLWWLLFCWMSNKIWKVKKAPWRWYKKTVDKAFIVLPVVYKTIFGGIIAIFLVQYLLFGGAHVFHYSDLKKLIN